MLKRLLSVLSRDRAPGRSESALPLAPAPEVVSAPGVQDFDVLAHLVDANGAPVLDWSAAQQWVERINDAGAKRSAWAACELAWLEHLRVGLEDGYRLSVQGNAVLLSSLERNVAEATLAFMGKTLQRVMRVLDGIANQPESGHDILVLFDDDEGTAMWRTTTPPRVSSPGAGACTSATDAVTSLP